MLAHIVFLPDSTSTRFYQGLRSLSCLRTSGRYLLTTDLQLLASGIRRRHNHAIQELAQVLRQVLVVLLGLPLEALVIP
jgi:hypothetical protein